MVAVAVEALEPREDDGTGATDPADAPTDTDAGGVLVGRV